MAHEKHFAFIPKRTTHSKELNSLSLSARWIYVLLVAERGGLTKPFFFPYTKIQEVTGCAATTIRRAIKELEKAGFLEVEHGGLERNPNQYKLEDSRLKL